MREEDEEATEAVKAIEKEEKAEEEEEHKKKKKKAERRKKQTEKTEAESHIDRARRSLEVVETAAREAGIATFDLHASPISSPVPAPPTPAPPADSSSTRQPRHRHLDMKRQSERWSSDSAVAQATRVFTATFVRWTRLRGEGGGVGVDQRCEGCPAGVRVSKKKRLSSMRSERS